MIRVPIYESGSGSSYDAVSGGVAGRQHILLGFRLSVDHFVAFQAVQVPGL